MSAAYLIFKIVIAMAISLPVGYDAKDVPAYQELPCTSFGGLCVLSNDCPKGKQTPVKGLCPLQYKSDVVCCYSIPMSETRCQKHGGECILKKQQCPYDLTFFRATDCGAEEKCCILVN